MGRRLRRVAPIVAFLMIVLAGVPGRAADLVSGIVTPGASILPLGATLPLTTTGRFTDGTTRSLSHATIAMGANHACVLAANGEVRCWGEADPVSSAMGASSAHRARSSSRTRRSPSAASTGTRPR